MFFTATAIERLRKFNARVFSFIAICGSKIMFNIIVSGGEKIGPYGPVIVASTHSNMSLDTGVICYVVPRNRVCSFWVKATLFKNKISGFFFSAINSVPVIRRRDSKSMKDGKNISNNKNSSEGDPNLDPNSDLWSATLDMLAKNGTICAFPEGTSYTLPHLLTFRDGIARATLLYTKLFKQGIVKAPLLIVPFGITYVNKWKFRGLAIGHVGEPISVGPEFLNMSEFDITDLITERVKAVTINAPDWSIQRASEIAHRLMIPLAAIDFTEYVSLVQAFVDIFTAFQNNKRIGALKKSCNDYRSLLRICRTRDVAVISYFLGHGVDDMIRVFFGFFFFLPLMIPACILYFPYVAISAFLYFREPFYESRGQMIGSFWVLFCPLLTVLYMLFIPFFIEDTAFVLLVKLLVAIFVAYMSSDFVVDAWLTMKAGIGLFNCNKEIKIALVESRKSSFNELKGLFEKDSYRSWINEELFNALPKGPFDEEKSVPPGVAYPEPRHLPLKIPTFERVLSAFELISKAYAKVKLLGWIDEDGFPKASSGRSAFARYSRDYSGRKIFFHEFIED